MTQGPPPFRRDLAARLIDLRLAFMRLRRAFKARLPYVRRRVYRKLERRYAEAITALRTAPAEVDACALRVAKAAAGPLGPDLCLFVTYAPVPRLKRHVVRHVEALLEAGVKVVLVANTPLPPDRLEVDPPLLDRLTGLYVRANEGFDFAAWAHALRLLEDRLGGCERIVLTNDSIVGPLRPGQLVELFARIRASTADVLGLTENSEPRPHLQSFFLVFQRRALSAPHFVPFWRSVRSLPRKELVIDFYETWLTEQLSSGGLRCEPLFQLSGRGEPGANDVYYRWPQLIEAGCPFVKTSVLEAFWGSRAVEALVPREILDAYEFANTRGGGSSTPGGR